MQMENCEENKCLLGLIYAPTAIIAITFLPEASQKIVEVAGTLTAFSTKFTKVVLVISINHRFDRLLQTKGASTIFFSTLIQTPLAEFLGGTTKKGVVDSEVGK